MSKQSDKQEIVFIQTRITREFRLKIKEKMAKEGIETMQDLIKGILEKWLKEKDKR